MWDFITSLFSTVFYSFIDLTVLTWWTMCLGCVLLTNIQVQRMIAPVLLKRVSCPLKDIVHYNIGDLSHSISEIINTTKNYAVYLFLFLDLGLGCWTEFIRHLTYIFAIRAVSIYCTLLPPLLPVDIHKEALYTKSIFDIFLNYLYGETIDIGHYGDLLFSGHVSFFFLTSLHLQSTFLHFVTLLLSTALVVNKNHYTIDVMYAYIVTYLVYTSF